MADGNEIIAPISSAETWQRAGFWHRLIAAVIDGFTVALPLQILVVILFLVTNGHVQGSAGFTTTRCVAVSVVPPPGFNSTRECRTSFLGFDTAHTLVLDSVSQDGTVNTSSSTKYTLGPDGRPNDAFIIDGFYWVLSLAYLIILEYRFGQTLGKYIVSIRTIDVDVPERVGIPLKKAVFRQLAMLVVMMLPLLPALLSMLFISLTMTPIIVSLLLMLAWYLWIIISIVERRDPIYDQLAGTAVITNQILTIETTAPK